MTEDKVNDNEAKVNETQISQDLFNVKVKVEGVDEKGSPINAEVDATYPREAVEKPFMAGDEEQHNIRNGFINYVSNYKGITPEQELAIHGIAQGKGYQETQLSKDGPSESDVVAGRPVEPVTAGGPNSAGFSEDPKSTQPERSSILNAVPTGVSDLISELSEKINEQIRGQIKDIQGCTMTIAKQEDGSVKIDWELKRLQGAVPQSADDDTNHEVMQITENTNSEHNEKTYHGVTNSTRPTTIRFGIGTSSGQPTNEDADSISSNVSSAASVSQRKNELFKAQVACFEVGPVAISVNVNLFSAAVTL